MAQPRILDEIGLGCPQCRMPSQIREHAEIRPKQLNQPYYFSRWFYCTNDECEVSAFHDEKYKVWNNNERAQELRRLEAIQHQLAHGGGYENQDR